MTIFVKWYVLVDQKFYIVTFLYINFV